MEPWAKRIKDLLDAGAENGLSEAGLAKACKAKQPSVWQWFNSTEKKPNTKKITAINAVRAARYLGTTAEYIITGQGPMSLSQAVELDLSMLQSAIVAVKKALRNAGLELDAFIASPTIAFAYRERLKLPREMSKPEYEVFDSMIARRLYGELGHDRTAGPASDGREGSAEEAKARRQKAGAG